MSSYESRNPYTHFKDFDVVRRIWERDESLWVPASPGGGGDWLGWLDLPEALDEGIGIASDAQRELLGSLSSFNILGMGGSSLTVEVLRSIFQDDLASADTPRLNVFDTVNPRTIGASLGEIDPFSTVFALSSKSGTTVEPLSLEKVFRSALERAGVEDVASRFIAISDEGTPAAQRAASGEFAAHVSAPANVGGRYSALSAFGMFPASVCDIPVRSMAESAVKMAESCKLRNHDNPGLQLGKFMAENAQAGRDKVTIVASAGIERFGLWLEQLLAESTGKSGKGLVPIVGEPMLSPRSYGSDRQFILVSLGDEELPVNQALRDHPTFHISIPDKPSVAGEFFRWQFATAVAAYGIGVYPFDQPDVESAKELAREILRTGETNALEPVSSDEAVESTLDEAQEGDYIAFSAFLPESLECTQAFSELRRAVSSRTGIATTFGYGPRYLHSTGQLHKGGPASCKLLVFTQDDHEADIEVPGTDYTLGQLSTAQAIADVLALRKSGSRAQLISLDSDPVNTILDIAGGL